MKSASGYVYFIKPVGQEGPIKIGHSIYPPERLAALQTWSPLELEIVCVIAGTRAVESAIHSRFAAWQARGEWFEATPNLRLLIAALKRGDKIEHLIDFSLWKGGLAKRAARRSPEAKVVGSYKVKIERARQYASGVRGRVVSVPAEIKAVLSSAGGYRTPYRQLSDAERLKLDHFISDCRATPTLEQPAPQGEAA
jgi:hypothetical protein